MSKGKKFRYLFVALCLCIAFLGICACNGNENGGGTTQPKEESITLDLFDTATLDASELTGDITWTTSDDKVVKVSGGIATPVAEGKADITASADGQTKKFSITVEDSGARPTISRLDDIVVYETQTYNLADKVSVTYKEAEITSGVVYTYKAVAGNVSVSEDGIVTGVKEGIDQINVSATYRGYAIPKKVCNVTVNSANFVEAENAKMSLSIVDGDIDPKSAEIKVKRVVVNAQEIKDAEVTASIVSGEEFVTVNGLTVSVKGEAMGKAVIELSSTENGKTVKGTVEVTVHDDSVEFNPAFLQGTGSNMATLDYVTEGDEAGTYKYTSSEGNYWQRAIQNSADAQKIAENGYKAFVFDLKITTDGVFSLYIPTALSSGNFIRLKLSDGSFTDVGTTPIAAADAKELFELYDASGVKLDKNGLKMTKDTWYTVVYDLTSYEAGHTMIGFTFECVDADGEQTVYMKNFSWRTTAKLLTDGGYDATHTGAFDKVDDTVTTEKDEFINNISIGTPSSVKVGKVVRGDFTDSYKLMSKASGLYANRITFNDIHNADGRELGKFFNDGNHYISFKVYVQKGVGFNVSMQYGAKDGQTDVSSEGTLNATTNIDGVSVFNDKDIRSPLVTGAWYTIVVKVDYEQIPAWALIYFGISGSKYQPGVAYIKDLTYSVEMPIVEKFPGESEKLGVEPGNATLEDLEEIGENKKNIVKYIPKGQNCYAGRVHFTDVSSLSAQSQSAFFDSDYEYVKFQILINKESFYTYFLFGYAWTGYYVDLNQPDSPVKVTDTQGQLVGSEAITEATGQVNRALLKADEWYTVVMHIDKKKAPAVGNAPMWCGIAFRSDQGADNHALIKNIEYLDGTYAFTTGEKATLETTSITHRKEKNPLKYSVGETGAGTAGGIEIKDLAENGTYWQANEGAGVGYVALRYAPGAVEYRDDVFVSVGDKKFKIITDKEQEGYSDLIHTYKKDGTQVKDAYETGDGKHDVWILVYVKVAKNADDSIPKVTFGIDASALPDGETSAWMYIYGLEFKSALPVIA